MTNPIQNLNTLLHYDRNLPGKEEAKREYAQYLYENYRPRGIKKLGDASSPSMELAKPTVVALHRGLHKEPSLDFITRWLDALFSRDRESVSDYSQMKYLTSEEALEQNIEKSCLQQQALAIMTGEFLMKILPNRDGETGLYNLATQLGNDVMTAVEQEKAIDLLFNGLDLQSFWSRSLAA